LGGRKKKKSQESRNIIEPIAFAQSVAAVADCGLFSQNHVPLTPALLRLDPMFDPLRNGPRFQKLVASRAPKKQ
jgi:hypothetical protein